MKDPEIGFHGSAVFLMPEKRRSLGVSRRRLERNPFLEPFPGPLLWSDEEEKKWRANSLKFLKACFNEATARLGEDEARDLFAKAAPGRKRGQQRGATRGKLFPDRDRRLLSEYDGMVAAVSGDNERRAIPRLLSVKLYATGERGYGHSAAAIQKQIWRLLDERKRRQAEAAREAEKLRVAFRQQTGREFDQIRLSWEDVADNE
jgi:hypothetical protein